VIPIPSALITLLRCPVTHQALEPADQATIDALNAQIRAASLRDVGGRPVTDTIDGALRRADGKLVYPVRHSVACLFAQDALPL
jgi:uncharacterized protein YbaR (Trm112 family)